MLESNISYIANWYFGSDFIVILFHWAHGIRFKLVSNWEQSMLYTKSLEVLHREGISMLTGLKVSSLTCKCVFYRPELNAKAGTHRIEFFKPWNIPMDTTLGE